MLREEWGKSREKLTSHSLFVSFFFFTWEKERTSFFFNPLISFLVVVSAPEDKPSEQRYQLKVRAPSPAQAHFPFLHVPFHVYSCSRTSATGKEVKERSEKRGTSLWSLLLLLSLFVSCISASSEPYFTSKWSPTFTSLLSLDFRSLDEHQRNDMTIDFDERRVYRDLSSISLFTWVDASFSGCESKQHGVQHTTLKPFPRVFLVANQFPALHAATVIARAALISTCFVIAPESVFPSAILSCECKPDEKKSSRISDAASKEEMLYCVCVQVWC